MSDVASQNPSCVDCGVALSGEEHCQRMFLRAGNKFVCKLFARRKLYMWLYINARVMKKGSGDGYHGDKG